MSAIHHDLSSDLKVVGAKLKDILEVLSSLSLSCTLSLHALQRISLLCFLTKKKKKLYSTEVGVGLPINCPL